MQESVEERDGEPDPDAFGVREPGRFAADVEYHGVAGDHDYLVRVRHRLLDTSFTVVVDGVEHAPKAEQKALEAREREAPGDDGQNGAPGPTGAPAPGEDDLRFRVAEHFTGADCTVRRPRPDAEHVDSERITIRTTGFGGAGEVEIRHGFRTTHLVPSEGSPSAVRDATRAAHPVRFALLAAAAKGAKFLIPLLGFGALFSGLLDPVEAWIEARIRPVVEEISRATAPAREWIAEVTRPVREVIDTLLSPLRDAVRWLLGLLPEITLPVDVPGWVIDVLVPVLVVVAVFAATYSGIAHRRRELAASARAERPASARAERPAGVRTEGARTEGAQSRGAADAQEEAGGAAVPEEAVQPVAADGSGEEGEAAEASPCAARNSARSAGESSTQN
ncbi:hypothetical protein [Brachybacterium saurashtrense]|uniref:hypothetical protein n=1 Tax=Brachybacterium saurashtrense TaxID=556288 RepID=UPI000F8D700E|nr:hypothetical protein [Brachybacterium saurashtrense]